LSGQRFCAFVAAVLTAPSYFLYSFSAPIGEQNAGKRLRSASTCRTGSDHAARQRPHRPPDALERQRREAGEGKKRFSCDIQLNAALAEEDARWTTLIHECLHAVSAGYSLLDYQDLLGWEEGLVEQMQRLLRRSVLAKMGVSVPDALLDSLDAGHPYNVYIRVLEVIRLSLAVSEVQFYSQLLAMPLAERPTKMLMQAYQLPIGQRQSTLRIVSVANAVLKQKF
jgi:hypothetical protein